VAELTPSERLQPCLLDRISDDDPRSKVESRDQRVVSLPQLRRAVLRDLVWLLNTPSKDRTGEFDDFPMIRQSVLNYGMPDLAGLTTSGVTGPELESMVREAIRHFEPRLLEGSIEVRAVPAGDRPGFNAVAIEIRADMWAEPLPEQLHLKTRVDLETGHCRLEESGHG